MVFLNISIICPLYNAEKYLVKLHNSIMMQKDIEIESINYVITKSNDRTEEICKELNCNYNVITCDQFSHSRTRQQTAYNVKGDIIVFITQDINIVDNHWLYNLAKDIMSYNCDAAFSRQICNSNSIEKYIRQKNYPDISRTISKKDIKKYGLVTFFFSDASSAVKRSIFIKLNGFDDIDLITNEDMYLAYKLIINNYKIKYCADSIIEHFHKFTYKNLFCRYFDTGVFFADNEFFNQYKVNNSGLGLASYVFKSALRDKNIRVLLDIIPNFAFRFMGMQFGRKYKLLPIKIVNMFSSNKGYWMRKSKINKLC